MPPAARCSKRSTSCSIRPNTPAARAACIRRCRTVCRARSPWNANELPAPAGPCERDPILIRKRIAAERRRREFDDALVEQIADTDLHIGRAAEQAALGRAHVDEIVLAA